jgi:hypothetical protein
MRRIKIHVCLRQIKTQSLGLRPSSSETYAWECEALFKKIKRRLKVKDEGEVDV